MQDLQKQDGKTVSELKDDLCTVVNALGLLQDFIESVFGAKFNTYYDDHQRSTCGNRDWENSDPRRALKELQWKNFNSSYKTEIKKSNDSEDVGISSGIINRTRTSSATSGNAERMTPIMVGEPEVIDVKCEVNCAEEILPDFLEDVDPFTGDSSGGYHYEGDTDINISSSYEISASTHNIAQQHHKHILQSASQAQQHSPDETSFSKGNSSNSNNSNTINSRFIPGLIPIQPDPLKNPDQDSESVSSDNSEKDWHPTSSSVVSKNKTSKRKRKRVENTSASQKRSTNISSTLTSSATSTVATTVRSPTILIGKTTIHQVPTPVVQTNHVRHHQQDGYSRSANSGLSGSSSSSPNLASGEGGPFKCTMCPASYKQEESLKSHQKYKHNPSRVQCQCPLCGKSMVDKYRLQRHLRLHTGEKPFECQYCGQSFYRKDYHTKHMQRKHGIHSSFPTATSSSSSTPSSTNSSAGSKGGSFKKTTSSGTLATSSTPVVTASAGRSRHSMHTASTPIIREVSFIKHEVIAPSNPTNPQAVHTVTTSGDTRLTSSTATTNTKETHHHHSASSSTSSFIDYFSSLGNTLGGGRGGSDNSDYQQDEATSTSNNSLGISTSSLVTMTSLTFDDLISADL